MSDKQIRPVSPDTTIAGLFLGDYISGAALGSKTPTLRIEKIQIERLPAIGKDNGGEPSEERDRPVVYFEKLAKGWVLNRTNACCLAAMFGPTAGAWIGKRVTLVAEMVRVGPKSELGIRVKGSPDLTKPVRATIELPRKKPTYRDLVPTGAPAQNPPPAETPAPAPDYTPEPEEPADADE